MSTIEDKVRNAGGVVADEVAKEYESVGSFIKGKTLVKYMCTAFGIMVAAMIVSQLLD